MAGPGWSHGDERRWRDDPRARDDFGMTDYSTDYGYDPRTRSGYRRSEAEAERRDDYGQGDYSDDWAYDPDTGRAYRRHAAGDPEQRYRDADPDQERRGPPRSWRERTFGAPRRHRRGPSDRVLWAVIVERLEDERGLDLRDVDVAVEDGEVTLNGTVRRKTDRRRIEDIADIDGVSHVQNNLRVRGRSAWSMF